LWERILANGRGDISRTLRSHRFRARGIDKKIFAGGAVDMHQGQLRGSPAYATTVRQNDFVNCDMPRRRQPQHTFT